jgi:serine protease
MSAKLGVSADRQTYAVATDGKRVLAFSSVQSDGTFLIHNLPPASRVVIVLASDHDGDGVLGEQGDVMSAPTVIETQMGVVSNVNEISLALADGQRPLILEAK